MAIGRAEFRVVPRNVREWGQFFTQLVVSPDPGTVTEATIEDDAVTTAKLDDESVTTAKLDDLAVTTAKIADGDVTTIKLDDMAVTTAKLDDGAVETAKIADGDVTLVKIEDITANRLLGRITTDGIPQELTAAQVATLLETSIEALNLSLTGTIGFHGEAASAQQATPSTLALATIAGTGDDVDINANFAAIQAAVNAIKAALDTKGLTG